MFMFSFQSLRDAFWDALMKKTSDRTPEDIEIMVENVQKFPVRPLLFHLQDTARTQCLHFSGLLGSMDSDLSFISR